MAADGGAGAETWLCVPGVPSGAPGTAVSWTDGSGVSVRTRTMDPAEYERDGRAG